MSRDPAQRWTTLSLVVDRTLCDAMIFYDAECGDFKLDPDELGRRRYMDGCTPLSKRPSACGTAVGHADCILAPNLWFILFLEHLHRSGTFFFSIRPTSIVA